MAKIPASEREAFYETRRHEIAEVALKLWAEKGFGATSVAAIAREAGIAKGTFYLYFESKDALLLDVFRRSSLIPNVLALIDNLQHQSLEEAVRTFVGEAWRHLSKHRDLVLLVIRELPSHLDHAHGLVERLIVPSNEALAAHLEARMDPARAKVLSSIISVRALIGMIVVVFLSQDVLGADKVSPVPESEVTNTIAELFLRGVAPPISEA
jgi:AcrR family transcriptional regulator